LKLLLSVGEKRRYVPRRQPVSVFEDAHKPVTCLSLGR
jgi:hypothetical protein